MNEDDKDNDDKRNDDKHNDDKHNDDKHNGYVRRDGCDDNNDIDATTFELADESVTPDEMFTVPRRAGSRNRKRRQILGILFDSVDRKRHSTPLHATTRSIRIAYSEAP